MKPLWTNTEGCGFLSTEIGTREGPATAPGAYEIILASSLCRTTTDSGGETLV
jgi:hypothetical protein